jgi:hypothetical protein
MKEYKLKAWPELPPEFRKTAFRRMVSELSQRHVRVEHLQRCSGLAQAEVENFLLFLDRREVLEDRGCEPEKPKVGWMRALFQG